MFVFYFILFYSGPNGTVSFSFRFISFQIFFLNANALSITAIPKHLGSSMFPSPVPACEKHVLFVGTWAP